VEVLSCLLLYQNDDFTCRKLGHDDDAALAFDTIS
jgi:hypothetical protein